MLWKENDVKIYLVHPVSGLSYDAVMAYYNEVRAALPYYEPLCPMVCKGYLSPEQDLKVEGYTNPVSTDHAIVGRDMWMVQQSDVVYADFTGATRVSIGCVCELAWAMLLRKHIVVVMKKGNPHYHSFILECANIVFETADEAIDYLSSLALGIQ
jgi:hypothetical protein